MRLTPIDIQQHSFKTVMRGFDPAEVEAFLEIISRDFEEVVKEMNLLKDELNRQNRVVQDFRDREAALRETMLTAQRITEDIKRNAQRDAEALMQRAEDQAEKIVRNAHERLLQIINDIHELKRQRIQLETALAQILDSHSKMLASARDTFDPVSIEEIVTSIRSRHAAPSAPPDEPGGEEEEPPLAAREA